MDSILSILKIGVGPSSSHTIGPISGALKFTKLVENLDIDRVKATLYGSLSLTGKGHMSDVAIMIGLSGVTAKNLTKSKKLEILNLANEKNTLNLGGTKAIKFDPTKDIIFNNSMLLLHENGFTLEAFKDGKLVKKETFYSTGGGYVYSEDELKNRNFKSTDKKLKFDFKSALKLKELCQIHNKSISQIALLREVEYHGSKEYVINYILEIYETMVKCYENGISATDLILPGGLNVKRLAPQIYKRLKENRRIHEKDPLAAIDFISMYARAVAEENASGARVVTAPTNGACGVVPAVMLYIQNHRFYMGKDQILNYLLTCCAIGYLYKENASISGAEAGCQAEVGVASSMAAAGMAAVSGGTTEQILIAAEIAMEHHLGLTCDPVRGLVQIPCIERNTLGAIKAISAVKLAMESSYSALVTLDEVILTMYKTGKDMDSRYKETSLAGLAKIVSC
ncbi:L-serine ammonia-lyase [Campylobacter corcagiensis]|nr:L-serine deaminase I [Campylobacter corcagiensis]